MKKSVYTDDQLVSAEHLNRTETTKEEAIKERFVASSQSGTFIGLNLVQTGPLSFQVSAGTGFTANGERILINTGSEPSYTLPATDGTYYILLRYNPVPSGTAPRFGGGFVSPTKIDDGFTVEHSTTYPVGVPEIEKTILIGIVIVSSGVISQIINTESFPAKIFAIDQPVTITGVFIFSTNLTDAQIGQSSELALEVTVNTQVGKIKKLKWKAPGQGFGTAVQIQGTGTYNLYSSDGITRITAFVDLALLPDTNQNEVLKIFNLYDRFTKFLPQYFSIQDRLHRSLVGSGVPDEKNPHGLTIEDIGGQKLVQETMIAHDDLQHSNGIVSSIPTVLRGIRDTSNPDDRLNVSALPNGQYVFLNGQKITNIPQTQLTFTDINPGANIAVLIEIALNSDRSFTRNQRLQYDMTWGTANPKNIYVRDCSVNYPFGYTGRLYFYTGPSRLKWDNGAEVILSGSGVYKLYGSNNVDWIEVYISPTGIAPTNGSFTDLIFMNNHINEEEQFWIGNVLWFYDLQELYGDEGPYSSYALDKRLFGTISKENLRSDVFEFSRVLRDQILAETRGNGIVQGYHAVTATGTTLDIVGGRAYINGKRIERAGITYNTASATFTANASNLVYLDEDGNFGVVLESSFTDRMSNGKYRIPIWKVVLDSSKVIVSSFDARVGIGLVSPIVPGQETLPFRMGSIRTLKDSAEMIGEDKCLAKWGNGLRGYTRLIILDDQYGNINEKTARFIISHNLRWDGNYWYKDVANRGGYARIFITTGTNDAPTYGRPADLLYYVPANAPVGPHTLDVNKQVWHIGPSATMPGIMDFWFPKWIDGTTPFNQIHFFGPGGDLDLVHRGTAGQRLRFGYFGIFDRWGGGLVINFGGIVTGFAGYEPLLGTDKWTLDAYYGDDWSAVVTQSIDSFGGPIRVGHVMGDRIDVYPSYTSGVRYKGLVIARI